MKKVYKYAILIVLLISYYLIPPINNILSKELNVVGINYIFGKSLYDDIAVSSEYVEVMDYYIENELLYVFPINGEIRLPISVSILKVDNNSLEVVDNNIRYYIYNVDKRSKSLYQYAYAKDILGYTNDYYIIDSSNTDYIVSKLIINYESI